MDYKEYIKTLLKEDTNRLTFTNRSKTLTYLTEILKEEMENFHYTDKHDITYLFPIFDLYLVLINSNKDKNLYNEFTYIHNTMHELLHTCPKNLEEKQLDRIQQLKNLIHKMENTMLSIYFDNPTEYDPNQEEFIYYLVFKLKKPKLFAAACEKFPYVVNSLNKEGVPLIENVLKSYLEALEKYLLPTNLGPLGDLIYYGKVIEIIMNSKKVNNTDSTIKYLLEQIKRFVADHTFENNRHKEKFSFFINDIINVLTGEKENHTLDYLSYKYEIHNRFKEAHLLEARTIYFQNKDIGEPTTTRKIYTFDGNDAKELDDGISISYEDGIYHLGVHIAYPNAYIPKNSILIDEAIRRTTSIYLGNECIPLYPLSISGNLMSLNQGKCSHMISHYFDIDERTGDLLNYEIKNEKAYITQNLTYSDFDEMLDRGTDDKELFESLLHFSNISDILRRICSEYGLFTEKDKSDDSPSTFVIASMMIYTNYQLAKLFSDKSLPFIYRCHVRNKEEIDALSKLQERLKSKNLTADMIKEIEKQKNILPKAYYTSMNEGHYALELPYYSHSTSPLRREPDNIAIECIEKFILTPYKKRNIDLEKRMLEKIEKVAETTNTKRDSIDDYVIQYELKKLADK